MCRIGVLALVLLVLLPGCRSTGGVPVRDASKATSDRTGVHVVRKGDTLYSIAWRYGFDYKDLAAANNIYAPYTIYVGQNIALRVSSAPRPVTKRPAKPVKPVQRPVKITSGTLIWQWPVKGQVIKGFSLNGDINKGLDISGKVGDRVNAAAEGLVVYAGGNLRGYGKLVIVKHSDIFLSAYGNNEEIRVKEGDRVKRGQQVARVGASGSVSGMLHFEIRRNGKPEDPVRYLPKL